MEAPDDHREEESNHKSLGMSGAFVRQIVGSKGVLSVVYYYIYVNLA